MKTVLVTGGAGFIGSHICDALLDKGSTVICVDDFNDYYNPMVKEKNIEEASKKDKFVLYRADITNENELRNVFEENEIDNIVHLAARAGVRASFYNPQLYEKVNVEGTRNLLELSKEFKIKNFIFGSSSSVYGTNNKIPFSEEDPIKNTISPYAETKKQAERLCKEYSIKFALSVTCLRFFTVYGPRGRPDMAPYKFTKLITEGKPIYMYGDGTSRRDYTYVTDIVAGVLSVLDKNFGFEIINLGNSDTIELRYLISLIEKETGKKAKINRLPMQKGDVLVTYADISKARRLLNYNPKVKIQEGIRLFVRWFENDK